MKQAYWMDFMSELHPLGTQKNTEVSLGVSYIQKGDAYSESIKDQLHTYSIPSLLMGSCI